MKLIDIEPYFWELYQDEITMYLSVSIHHSFVTWEKSICLDEEAISNYNKHGKPSIDALAKRIESSEIRKDDERFYAYKSVDKEQRSNMYSAFMHWKKLNQIS